MLATMVIDAGTIEYRNIVGNTANRRRRVGDALKVQREAKEKLRWKLLLPMEKKSA